MPRQKSIWKRIFQTHLYLWYTKLYWTVFKSLFQLTLIIGILLTAYYFIDHYVFDVNMTFARIIDKIDHWQVYLLFFFSESVLGLIPPDLFIIWAAQLMHSWAALTLLAFLAYSGGIASYSLGYLSSRNKFISSYIEKRFFKNVKNLKRYGTIFIFIAAIFPLPYSPTCLLAGLMKYPFKRFLYMGIFRIARFYIYAIFIFKIV